MKFAPQRRPSILVGRALFAALLVSACTEAGGDESGDEGGELVVPELYEFSSRFDDGSSVAYSGQTFRQVLITSLKAEMSTIQSEIESEGAVFSPGEVRARLDFYYRFDSETAGELPHGLSTDPPALQTSFNDISSDKDLQGKIAGNDAVGQHVDWNSVGIVGWSGTPSPDALIAQWLDEVDALAVAYSSGSIPLDPHGAAIPVWFVDAQGRDYQQLLQKFLLGAVNFSQSADDYLDDDEDGKGLLADNVDPVEGKSYTALEHAWDEGFGYWGAARDYLSHDDGDLAEAAAQDSDGDGSIDLLSEYSFGASVNASKRDAGSSEQAPTDFSTQTMEAFLSGRAIIAHADGALSEEELLALQEQRDAAVLGWEKTLASTAVHYVNDTLQDLHSDDASFADLAKHWSELKGFVLSLQFNPRMQLSEADFAELNARIGEAPRLDDDYVEDLLVARDLMGAAYNFDPANLGDELGEGGW